MQNEETQKKVMGEYGNSLLQKHVETEDLNSRVKKLE